MSASDGNLLRPTDYNSIANPEDRLFVPDDYVLLFEAKGWKRG